MPKTGLTHGAIMEGSDVQLPVEIQGRATQTIQSHNAVSIPANGWNSSSWFDVSAYDKVAVSANMTSGTGMTLNVDFSHDGVNFFANSYSIFYDGTQPSPAFEIPVMSKFVRVSIKNKDATNAKTTSAYLFLKP